MQIHLLSFIILKKGWKTRFLVDPKLFRSGTNSTNMLLKLKKTCPLRQLPIKKMCSIFIFSVLVINYFGILSCPKSSILWLLTINSDISPMNHIIICELDSDTFWFSFNLYLDVFVELLVWLQMPLLG